MTEQTTLNPNRGEIITSVEPDAVFLEARNAHIQADAAYSKALEALAASQQVEANAANALSQATTAISLANAAQTTADNALASQVSITGATLTGPLYLHTASPSAPYEAAAKQYVDTQVSTIVTDGINSVAALKADKTYVDSQDAALQSQINTGSTSITDLYSKVIPSGGIIMWSGPTTSIPTGWRLCDGTNGTPDLRNRFIMGSTSTSGSLPPNSTGGSTSQITNLAGAHTHNATIDASGAHAHNITVTGTSLGLDQIPPHNHSLTINKSDVDSSGGSSFTKNVATTGEPVTVFTSSIGAGAPHTHLASSDSQGLHTHTGSIQTTGDHSHTVQVTPPFYALAFIMKT